MPPSDERPSGATRASNLEAVYQELILDHYRRPRNRGTLEQPDVAIRKKNPLCGDEITLQIRFGDDTIRELRFSGQGCAISQASASMMTQRLAGRPAAEAARVLAEFTRMIEGDPAAATDPDLGDLRALAGVARLPARHPCALLAWTALADALATHR